MNSFVLALRAIGAQLALRLYVPVAVAAAVCTVLLIGGTLWLTTLSEWWWLLFIPVIIIACVGLAIGLIALLLIRYIRPDQTRQQKQTVNQFVDKLQGVADIVGTPKIIILFRVIRSIAAPSKEHYLSDLVENKNLARDFRELEQLFKP